MMNVKTLVAMTVSSILAASLTYAAPATDADFGQAQLTDGISGAASMSGSATSGSGAAVSGNANVGAATPMSGSSATPAMSGTSSSSGAAGNDDVSADTATGDDDY